MPSLGVPHSDTLLPSVVRAASTSPSALMATPFRRLPPANRFKRLAISPTDT
jgi:hypothetical protein